MIKLKEALEEMRGKCVDIYTKHRLWGNQHIQMEFDPEIKFGYGFRCGGQAIYICDNDVIDYNVAKDKISISGKNMEIDITITS